MVAAMKKETQGLLERGTFKVVAKTEIPQNANLFSAHYVLAVKNNDGNEVYKARSVIGGHCDVMKTSSCTSLKTFSQQQFD